ncbi:MAG: hypothetical protein E7496_11835 [Ruminococcus sp.]|nr:hypothetical protein [Ruminococcus sp.]
MKKTKKTALTAAAFAAAMGMAVGAQGLPAESNAEYNSLFSLFSEKGDMDGDNLINLTDVVFLQKYLMGRQSMTQEQFYRADMNEDGRVNIFDLMLQKKELLDLCNIPQAAYGPPEWFESSEATEETEATMPPTEYIPATDEPVCVYGPPEYFGITEPETEETDETETDAYETDIYAPESDFPVDVYGPPEYFGITENQGES